jgi:hypothetical protein
MVYIVYNKIVIQHEPLTRLLKKGIVNDWSAFMTMMFKTMEADEKLCAGVASFSPI